MNNKQQQQWTSEYTLKSFKRFFFWLLLILDWKERRTSDWLYFVSHQLHHSFYVGDNIWCTHFTIRDWTLRIEVHRIPYPFQATLRPMKDMNRKWTTFSNILFYIYQLENDLTTTNKRNLCEFNVFFLSFFIFSSSFCFLELIYCVFVDVYRGRLKQNN